MTVGILKIITRNVLVLAALLAPQIAGAHCDALDGPVVTAARAALEHEDVAPTLGWVRAEDEPEIRRAFESTLAVRKLGPEPRELADRYFFETLVRVHRAGEGAAYTGLKPAGSVEPGIAMADQALAKGSVDSLARELSESVAAGLRMRFQHTLVARKDAGRSVEAQREYVHAYVEFIHYAERLHQDARAAAGHHEEGEDEAAAHGHD